MNAGLVGISLLAPALRFTKAANILPQARADIHAEVKTPVSTIDLQTISDNMVDFLSPDKRQCVTDSRQGKINETTSRRRRDAAGALHWLRLDGYEL